MPTVIEKQPRESKVYDFNFVNEDGETDFRTGEAITSIISITITPQGLVTEVDALVYGDVVHDGDKIVQVRLTGGTDGEKYNISVLVYTDLSNTHECDGTMKIKEVVR